jgi:hypothetical protein
MPASAVEVMTGTDHAVAYRGNYSTIEEGLALLSADGFEDQVALVASLYTEIPILRATEGDIAVVQQGRSLGLGIVLGSTVAVTTLRGIAQLPFTAATRIFEVPA